MSTEEQILKDFNQKKSLYDDYTTKIEGLLNDLLSPLGVKFLLNSRTKKLESIQNKIKRKEMQYNSLEEITDISAARIIVNHPQEVDKVISLLESEFIIDQDNSTYKNEDYPVDQFGYRTKSVIICLKEDRLNLTEWKRFKDLKSEIQVRTNLQHAWAEISHK